MLCLRGNGPFEAPRPAPILQRFFVTPLYIKKIKVDVWLTFCPSVHTIRLPFPTQTPGKMLSRPPVAYRVLVGTVRLAMRLFFREISCEGRERIPTDGGGLVVSWHPNGLIDPALILAYFPGKIVFGARHGLFAWPALGWLMRRVGTVPIYRAADRSRMSLEERRKANQASLDGPVTPKLS